MELIALDLDGTLLTSNKTVSERSLEAIGHCQKAGLKVAVATARAPRNVKRLLPEEYGTLPWVCYNGAEIHLGENRIYENLIPAEAAIEAVERIESLFPESPVRVEINGQMFSNQPFDYPWEYEVARLQEVITEGVAKIPFRIEDSAEISVLNEQLPLGCKLLVTNGGVLGTVMSSSASKLVGVQYLAGYLGFSMNKVMAFGDDFNDIELINACGMGVAMGNAEEELKRAADHVTQTNDRDGVAVFLEDYLKGLVKRENG